MAIKIEIGTRVHMLVLIEELGRKVIYKTAGKFGLFKCDCGKEVEYLISRIAKGDQQSCGCLRISGRRNIKHGMARSSEYNSWRSILGRCYNPKKDGYHSYGGRGIEVCDRWLNSFENFYADMGTKPSSKHSIDRIDSNKDYCPDNCKWATPKEQLANRRVTVKVVYNDEEIPLSLLADKLNIDYSYLYLRLIKKKWSIEKAISYYQTSYKKRDK